MQEDAENTAEAHKDELVVRSPRRHMSPKSVREFVNERIGVQARAETLKTEIARLEAEKVAEREAAVTETTVSHRRP